MKVNSIYDMSRWNASVKKFSFGQNRRYKKYIFFSFVSSNSSQFYFSFVILCELRRKVLWDFPFSIPSRFYQSLYFCSTKSMNYLTLKRHNSFQNKNNKKATHSFALRPQIFKLQQEVWKFNDICRYHEKT